MLTLRNLCKSFDNGSERLPLFHHLDLALPAGQITHPRLHLSGTLTHDGETRTVKGQG